MNIFCIPLSTQKNGNLPEHNEDWICENKQQDTVTICVCDGSTESLFSNDWSKELANNFNDYVKDTRCEQTQNNITEDCKENVSNWEKWLNARADSWESQLRRKKLSYIAKIRMKEGNGIAYSTLLGISIEKSSKVDVDYCFTSYHIGDSCLIRLTKDEKGEYEVKQSMPIENHEDFNNRPNLIGSREPWPELIIKKDDIAKDETLLMMTDALAHWFLFQYNERKDKNSWKKLIDLKTDDELRKLFSEEHPERILKNDDLTIAIITFGPESSKRNFKGDESSEVLQTEPPVMIIGSEQEDTIVNDVEAGSEENIEKVTPDPIGSNASGDILHPEINNDHQPFPDAITSGNEIDRTHQSQLGDRGSKCFATNISSVSILSRFTTFVMSLLSRPCSSDSYPR